MQYLRGCLFWTKSKRCAQRSERAWLFKHLVFRCLREAGVGSLGLIYLYHITQMRRVHQFHSLAAGSQSMDVSFAITHTTYV
jgi:hypothetical protein